MRLDPSVKKVLIYRVGGLSGIAVALPCLHFIERIFPNSERRMLTNFPADAKTPAAAAVLGKSGLVQDYMRHVSAAGSPSELLRVAREIRRFAPDVLVCMMPVRPLRAVRWDEWFFRIACGIERILGVPGPKPDPDQLRHSYDPTTGLYESEAHRLARAITRPDEVAVEDLANWNPRLTVAEKRVANAELAPLAGRRLIVCGPGAGMQARDWGQENWRTLLGRLSARYSGHGLVLIGSHEDEEAAAFVAQDWRGHKANLCGRLNPRETAAVLSHARVYLGPDAWPMHLAASVGATCVVAFSARERPGVWYPAGTQHRIVYHEVNCFGCGLETCIAEGRKCLTSITVEEMQQAVESVLE